MKKTSVKEPKIKQEKGSYDLLEKYGARALFRNLLIIWLTCTFAFSALILQRLAMGMQAELSWIIPYLGFTFAVIFEYIAFRKDTISADIRSFEIISLLVGIGIIIQFRMGTLSGGGGMGFKFALPISFIAMYIAYRLTANGKWKHFEKVGLISYILSIAILLIMVVFGRKYRGGIYLPGNINPTEFIKPLLVIFLAAYLAKYKKDFSDTVIGIPKLSIKRAVPLIILWAIPMVLVMAIHDLGLLLLLNATLIIMLFAASQRIGYLFIGTIAAAGVGYLLCITSPHVQARVNAWLNPFEDPTNIGWQILQSLSAIYAGGIWGAGLGAGSPHAVPIVTSDFVYAAISEELGIIVCIFVLLLYTTLYMRGIDTAMQTKQPLGRLLAIGLTTSLAAQTILNIAGVTKALPMTGIVLPFLSQGGSGLIAMMIMIGIIIGISNTKK